MGSTTTAENCGRSQALQRIHDKAKEQSRAYSSSTTTSSLLCISSRDLIANLADGGIPESREEEEEEAVARASITTNGLRVSTQARQDHRIAEASHLISPCSSVESSTITVTGRLSDVERKYHVDPRVLGRGLQGSVRLCVDRATGRRRAVKSVRKDDPAVAAGGLAREISLHRRMNHRGVVRLVDVFEDPAYVHLVADLCEGGELYDRIVWMSSADNGAACFPEDDAARIVRQILHAVSYMHKEGVVHRDIKPENILFETAKADSPVKIIDFGLARRHRRGKDKPMSTVVGTPYYIAPEILRRRYDSSCDLWSIGVLAYILLCGYPPFSGDDDNQTLLAVLQGQFCFPQEEWGGISMDAMDFIYQLLQIDPRRRMTAEMALKHPWVVTRTKEGACVPEEEEGRENSSENTITQ